MFNYLSATIPNTPPDYEFNQPPEKRRRSDEEIRDFVTTVEDRFGLPFGTLSGKCRKTIGGTMVPEVKRAAIYYLLSISKNSKSYLAKFFGAADQTTICRHVERARGFIENRDDTFLHYYMIIEGIAI